MSNDSAVFEPEDLSFVPYRLAAESLLTTLQSSGLPSPVVGIICGSGLSGLSNSLQEPTLTVPYGSIPGFPAHCTVPGHKGEVVFGMLSGVPTMCFRGRFHSYEGHDMKTVVLPVHVMRCLQVQICLVTNAAGALNPAAAVGDVLCVTDHMALPQLAGKNPLIGRNDDELGPRFPPTSNAYPIELRKAALDAAAKLNMDFVKPSGVYCFVSGPMYESKAECRFLRSLGGDAVGMSTIPEVLASHHCGMKTLVLSLMTNKVIVSDDVEQEAANHEEVLAAVKHRSEQMQSLATELVAQFKETVLPDLLPLTPVSLNVSAKARREHARRQGYSGWSSIWWMATTATAAVAVLALLVRKQKS